MMNDLRLFPMTAGNYFYLILCDVINYYDVRYASNCCESMKNVLFTNAYVI